MTRRKIDYWVIPPEADGQFVAALTRLDIPTYATDQLPPELAAVPATKPGSRGLK